MEDFNFMSFILELESGHKLPGYYYGLFDGEDIYGLSTEEWKRVLHLKKIKIDKEKAYYENNGQEHQPPLLG